ncbi:TIGR01244 family sulfur transferase [Celerinatantimonas sp. YJH-8]|uniref:TIGR01244 family sulfur transferase n=1 Tax=Celerinatantimonas sp. YJH-8 TaxID=3228714 RepID=UPI0038CA4FBF
MEIKKVTSDLSVSPQLEVSEIADIQAMGFKTIICNRPDGEAVHQPLFDEINTEAKRLGITSHYLPVISGNITAAEITQFSELFNAASPPVLAYCRTGTRSITLWALSCTQVLTPEEILQYAKSAGYDLSAIIPNR